MLYTTIEIVFELYYIPFLCAMLRPEFIKHSCYKFMFLIGCLDIIIVPCIAIISGVQCALGAHFCSNPIFYFHVVAIGSGCFYGVACACILLAIDRFFVICFPDTSKKIFGGKLIYFWLTLPVVYALFSLSQAAFVFNTKRFVVFTDPFIETPGMAKNPAFFNLTFHTINSYTTVASLGTIYLLLIIVVKIKTSMTQSIYITKLQKVMTLQALCICIEIWIAILIYVYIQYVPIPNFFEVLAHIPWICTHGDTPIVYSILNSSLRKEVLNMVIKFFKKPVGKVSYLTTVLSWSRIPPSEVSPSTTIMS